MAMVFNLELMDPSLGDGLPRPVSRESSKASESIDSIKSGNVSAAAVNELREVATKGDTETVTVLTDLLAHSDWEVRAAAIEALAQVANTCDDNDIDLEALEPTATPTFHQKNAVIGKLTALLRDNDNVVRYTAWEALGTMEDEGLWGGD